MPLKKLKQWFLSSARDLPWRNHPDPYAVWVSEVMLQQTQVTVVIPYFERWMQEFPTVQALAGSPLEKVIKAWEGLGYYSRARNLHEGAKFVMKNFQGKIPDTEKELMQIKGLGPYTVGAILSFAFKKKAAAVDGNVIRVLSRFLHIEEDVSKPKTVNFIRHEALNLLRDEEPWVINEALIELGATVCAKKPKCLECPLKSGCKGFLAGKAEMLPVKSFKQKVEVLSRIVAVVCVQDKVLLRRGLKGEIMSDLYEFPYVEGEDEDAFKNFLPKGLSLRSVLKEQKHSFTRYRVSLKPYLFEGNELFSMEGYSWYSLSEIKKLPFSSGHRRILQDFLKN